MKRIKAKLTNLIFRLFFKNYVFIADHGDDSLSTGAKGELKIIMNMLNTFMDDLSKQDGVQEAMQEIAQQMEEDFKDLEQDIENTSSHVN